MGEVVSEDTGTTKFLVPSLFVSQLTTRPAAILAGFILIDIANTFGTSVGVAGQIITAASIAGMIVAPFLAALSIKYRPRRLLLAGIALITLSALGCSFSFNYASMLLFYSLNGLGAAMVTPMVMTIVGEKIPEERRSGVIGLIFASTPMFSTLMGLTITQIVSRGWKTAYLLVVFPITTIGLILAFIGLPKAPSAEPTQEASSNVREGFRQLLGHRSALACIVGTALTMIAWGGFVGYMVSFFRQQYGTPTQWVGVIWSGATSSFVLGSLLVGRIVKRIGRRRLTCITALAVGVSSILFTNIPSYYGSIVFVLLTASSAALWTSSSSDLALDQVPEYRGAMMSLNSGSSRLGSALGAALGGVALTVGSYNLLGIVVGVMGIVGFLVFSIFTHDTREE
jgi:predicted MFS family arabinose efflux permease